MAYPTDPVKITHKYGWDQPATRSHDGLDLTIVTLFIALVFGVFALWITTLQHQIVNDRHTITNQKIRLNHLSSLVKTLDHACIPTDTGGGVTQCQQPNILQAPPTK